MLAYKSFNKGFSIDTSVKDSVNISENDFIIDESDKFKCGYQAAKILYQIGKRIEALHIVNKIMEISNIEPGLKYIASQFKQRISWEYISRSEGLPNESISDMKWEGNNLWIGMWTGGLAKYSGDSQQLTIYRNKRNGLISPQVRNIMVAGNKIWISTYDGLCYYDTKKIRWVREKGKLGHSLVKMIKIVNSDYYASILGSGLYRYDNKKNRWQLFFNKSRQVTDFLEFNNKLYLSTLDHGLFVYKNNNFVNITGNYCIKTLCGFDGMIWAGTHSKGILLINNNDMIEKELTVKDGLSSDYVETIESISNKLLIGTLGGGVCIFHPETGNFYIMDIKQGLPGNDVIRIAFKNNKIWFGTISGGIGILLTENYKDI